MADFCKQFNERTKTFVASTPTPVSLSAFNNRTFTFETKTPPTRLVNKSCTCLSVCPSVTYSLTYLLIYSLTRSLCLSVYLFIYLSVCLFFCLSVCLVTCLSCCVVVDVLTLFNFALAVGFLKNVPALKRDQKGTIVFKNCHVCITNHTYKY